MNDVILGTCSICGGPVMQPGIFWSVVPPTPSCARCHALPVQAYGPVMQMQPRGIVSTTTDVVIGHKETKS